MKLFESAEILRAFLLEKTMEIKELQELLQKTLHDFRQYVDKELKEIREKGVADPGTTEAVLKVNTRIDELQAKIQRPPDAKPSVVSDDAKEEQAYLRKGWNGMSEVGRAKALQVGSDIDGGFLVTPDTGGRIIQKIFDTTPMRRLASVVSITTDALEGPIDRDEVSSGWAGEAASRSATDTPVIGKWRIPVFEQYALPKATQQFLDDAGASVGTWLENKVADYFGRQENAAFVTGTGTLKPRGITTYTTAATADATRTWGQIEHVVTGTAGDWTAANLDKIFDLETALNPGYRQGASFLGPKSVLLKVRKFKTGDGQYLWQPGLQAGMPQQLIGYPYLESEDMPAIASASLSLAFANFREAYTIVDRQGIRVLRDPFTSKPYVLFYTTKRVGGGVLNFDAIKFMKFSS
jgi:HK97 family phage major capsid protein